MNNIWWTCPHCEEAGEESAYIADEEQDLDIVKETLKTTLTIKCEECEGWYKVILTAKLKNIKIIAEKE